MNLVNDVKNLNVAIVKRLFSMHKECVVNHHPSPLQIQIISFLEENKGKDIYQKDLEKEINVSKAAISGVIKTMEKKGIVERIQSSNDARKNRIVLSQQSLEVYHEKVKDLKKINEELVSGISKEELLEFQRILNKMKNNIRKEEE